MMEIMKNTVTGPQEIGTAADSASQIGSSGRLRKISISRCTVASIQPQLGFVRLGVFHRLPGAGGDTQQHLQVILVKPLVGIVGVDVDDPQR